MKTNQLMTAGAVAFAAFALWVVSRQTGSPVVAISPQPAQQQRDAGLSGLLDVWSDQERIAADVVQNSWIGQRIAQWEKEMNRE
jgi:hypothetical protein